MHFGAVVIKQFYNIPLCSSRCRGMLGDGAAGAGERAGERFAQRAARFQIVPFLVLLAMFYGLALTQYHDSFVTVLKTLGVFDLLLLAVCAWFTWGVKAKMKMENGR